MANSTDMFMNLIGRFNPTIPYQQRPMDFSNFDPAKSTQQALSKIESDVNGANTDALVQEYLQTGDESKLAIVARTNPEIANFLLEKKRIEGSLQLEQSKALETQKKQEYTRILAQEAMNGNQEAFAELTAISPQTARAIADARPEQMTPYQQAQLEISKKQLEQGDRGLDIKEQTANKPAPAKFITVNGKVLKVDQEGEVNELIDTKKLSPEQQGEAQNLLAEADGGDIQAAAALNTKYPEYYKALEAKRKDENYSDRTNTFKNSSDIQKVKIVSDLRKEVNANVEPYTKVLDNINRLEGLLKSQGGVSDRATVTIIQKILDPSSAVLPSEFRTIAESSGLWDRIVNYPDALASGRLPPNIIKQITEIAKQMKVQALENVKAYDKEGRYRADTIGASHRDVTGDLDKYLSKEKPNVNQANVNDALRLLGIE